MDVHPLIFEPIFKRRIWGGQRLRHVFGKDVPADQPIGESWELADLPEDKSVVASGPVAGKRIDELVRQWDRALGKLLDPCDQRSSQQRVASKLEEVIVHADAVDPEHLRPDGAQLLFQATARGVIRALEIGSCTAGVRERKPVDLTVG